MPYGERIFWKNLKRKANCSAMVLQQSVRHLDADIIFFFFFFSKNLVLSEDIKNDIFLRGDQGCRDKNQVTKCPFGSWKCPFISSKSVSFSFCDILIAFSLAVLKHRAQVAVSISIKFLFLFVGFQSAHSCISQYYCPLFTILSFAFIFAQMPTIPFMFFNLLHFLFFLFGTSLLISILIQIVKTIMRECGKLLHNIVKGHMSHVTFL